MIFCLKCGAENEDHSSVCASCGAPLGVDPPENEKVPPAYTEPSKTGTVPPVREAPPVQDQNYYAQRTAYYAPAVQPGKPADVDTGGLVAWSLITVLISIIPGIIALVNALNINKCATVAEQKKKISNAKIACIIGTVIGVLSIAVIAFGS